MLSVLFGFFHPSFCLAAPSFANAVTNGTINIPELKETSGLVASRNNPNVLWTHNDSGDSARIFAIDTQGRKLGIYTLPGATNTDYEDIGFGPGPITNVLYIYVGDIGDNNQNRSNIRVYQIPEPAVYEAQYLQPGTNSLKGVRTITLTYPDGAHNAESLFVDPQTGDLFIATKQSSVSRIYTAPKFKLDTNNNFTMTFVRQINFNIASAADISPSGTEIIIRQEEFAQLWTRTNGQSISNALAATPVSVPVVGTANGEKNGEGLAFDAIGSGYFTIGEDDAPQPLHYFARTSDDGPRALQRLVPPGSAWKYLADGSNQGEAWRSPDFDDTGWLNGLAQFGYGDGDEKTVVSFGPNANNKYITTYFRTTFTLSNAPCLNGATLKLVVDDGAAVYLNGSNVLHFQLATNAAYNTLAAVAQSTNLEDTWLSFSIDPHLLVNGTNTLAVEIHQAAVNDPDLSFDLQLEAVQSLQPTITSISLQPDGQAQLCFCGPTSSNLTVETSPDLVDWSTSGSVVVTNDNGAAIFLDTSATNFSQRFYRVRR